MLFLVHVEKVLLVATLFPEGSPQQMDPQCFGKNLKLDVPPDRTLPFNPGLGLALGECEPVSPKAGFVGSPGFKVGIFFM